MHDLGTLGGSGSYGQRINTSGQVTGYSYTNGNAEQHAYLWTPTTPNGASGTLQDLGSLGGTPSQAYGINASGQVVGDSITTEGVATHAFLYDGVMHDLGWLESTFDATHGLDINDRGQVTGKSGRHAILWTPTTPNGANGTMHDLGTLGGTDSIGWGINAIGQVTGVSQLPGNAADHAFLWTPTTSNGDSGTLSDLGTLGGTYSAGLDINARGQVAGFFFTTGFVDPHAFLYTSESGMVDLNSLIDPLSGWKLLKAQAINDAGQITGDGQIGGQTHSFLLTPIPEPASVTLLALGLTLLVWRTCRRSGGRAIHGAHGPMTLSEVASWRRNANPR